MASIMVNRSPAAEFPFFCGLKQGLQIQGSAPLSHLFYADDAVFIGEWFDDNLENLIRILNCFHLASGLKINVHKSQVLGVGVPPDIVDQGASRIGCAVMQTPFKYLGVMVGDHMSRYSAWSNTIQKVRARLSKWKVKTLSVGGKLTLLKSVLGAVPVYNMSIYKAPKGVLHEMEMIRNKFFNGADSLENKITWVAWDKVLASKKNRGLGVSSFYALNRALLLKWTLIRPKFIQLGVTFYVKFRFWLRKVLTSHCKIRVGDGSNTIFWLDTWILDMPLCVRFPRIFSLETVKEVSVAAKWCASSLDDSFRR
nr:RNA-directed DNA polymerase, eukaryota [Tanacetum cinerariifolium]